MKNRLPWHPDKYVNQLHCDGASIFHNISTKMQNFSFVADVDYLMVSLCQNLYLLLVCSFWMQWDLNVICGDI